MLIRLLGLRIVQAATALVGVVLCVVASGQAAGQTAMEVRLDVLLGSAEVLPERVDGPVWLLEPAPGRRLVQLPIRLTPGAEEEAIKKPAFDFQAGRFLCWMIPDPHQDATGRSRSHQSEASGPSNEELDDLATLLRRPSQEQAARSRGGVPTPEVAGLAGGGSVPEGAPRSAREITVRPDGTVAWSMDRAVPGQVRDGEGPYLLKLDAARLRELQPQRPDRLTRNSGEDQRAFAARQREVDVVYRDEASAFRDLQALVRELPESFEDDLPETVWAVFEVNVIGDALTLRGSPDGDWTLPLEDLAIMQGMAGSGGGRRGVSVEADQGIARLQRLAADQHPWTQRLVSAALCGSGSLQNASVGDNVYGLATKLLNSTDTLARNRVIYTLATIQPPTSATASLLKQSANQSGEQVVQLAAMSAQLAVDMAGQPDGGQNRGLSAAIATTNAMLRDPNGPDAGLVVEQFLQATAAPTGRSSGPPQGSDAQMAAINGVRFDGLPPERFDAAVAAVLRSVGERPVVASGWLDRQLLGSNDRAVVTRTMELMARADAPSNVVHPFAEGLTRLVFGSGAGGEAGESLDLTMTGAASIDSANHALFRLLNAGDASTKALAWQVLRHFELNDQPLSTGRNAPVVPAGGLDPLTQIVNAGFGTPSTPSSLVPFLARQPDTARTTEPLMRVVSDGDMASSRRASRELVGSGRQIGQALEAMSLDARVRFANRIYDRMGDGAEPVTGLLRIEQGSGAKVVKWFGDELAAGTLPDVAAWAPAAGGEDELLRLAVSRDEALGLGAIAALTAAAGGDRAIQTVMITRFKPQRNTLNTDAMRDAWTSAKQDIYTQRLAQAAGQYRMVIEVTGEASGDGVMYDPVLGSDPAGAPMMPTDTSTTQRSVIGVITLVAKGATVGFAGGTPELTVPSERLAMRIASPGQLKNWPIEVLQKLPLDQVNEPLDLLPEDNGVWRGSVMMPTGQAFELALEPFGGNSKQEAKPTDSEATDSSSDTDAKPSADAPGRIKPSDKDQAIGKNPFQ